MWTPDVLVITIGKRLVADEISLVADPNGVRVGSNAIQTSNDKLETLTGIGIIKSVE